MSKLHDEMTCCKLHMGLARYPVCFRHNTLAQFNPISKHLSSVLFFASRSPSHSTPSFARGSGDRLAELAGMGLDKRITFMKRAVLGSRVGIFSFPAR